MSDPIRDAAERASTAADDPSPLPFFPVPLRSDELVARIRELIAWEAITGGSPLAAAAEELCAYHLEMRDAALEWEKNLHMAMKRIGL
jgi:hypothetical protein